jgi:hypothetical protein
MLSGATLSAAEIVGTAVFRIVVSSDSIKNATATSHGKSRLLAADGRDEDGGALMESTPVRNRPSAFHFQPDQLFTHYLDVSNAATTRRGNASPVFARIGQRASAFRHKCFLRYCDDVTRMEFKIWLLNLSRRPSHLMLSA